MEIEMRVTRETLFKLAKDTVNKRFATDINVTAVFLVGSLRPEEAVVEGASDLDLLVIYNGEPPTEREIIKLSNDFHLDIAYESVRQYAQPRELRGDPWRGWTMWDPCLLYQKGRFFEYTQSIIRSQFDDTANLLKRARFFSVPAREAWYAMQLNPESAQPLKLLEAVSNAANALVVLNGAPLPERRLLAEFPARAQSLDQEDMIQTLFASAAGSVNAEILQQWLPAWEIAFQAAAQSPLDPRLHPVRLGYYKAAISSQLESDLPTAALWPLLSTWALISQNDTFNGDQTQAWNMVCAEMGLSPEALPERLQALDAYLDRLEEILEQIAV
jgi:predicted nucleotidyltransferase